MKILVCIDGSRTANEAVKFAGLLGRGLAADITLLHVGRCDLCSLVPSVSQRIKNMVRSRLNPIFVREERALRELGVNATRKIRVGSTVGEIVSEANGSDYDLAVIGSQGIKGIEMFFFGALSYKLIERIRKPILVIKKGRKGISRILVCTGGSTQAMKAVDFAAGINKAVNAQATLLYVAEKEDSASTARGVDILDKAGELFTDCGKVDKLILYGHRSERIVETAKRGDYDLVVLGETSMNPLKLLVSGSVVYEVLKRIKTPCLIVK